MVSLLISTNTPLAQLVLLEYSEIYCRNCKKVIGRYNRKFYTEDKIGECLKSSHAEHVREGHQVEIRLMKRSS